MDALLESIAERGWSAETREEFVRRYDREIGNYIVYLLSEYGILRDARDFSSLIKHVEARPKGRRPGKGEGESRLLDILEEVYVRTYGEVFEKGLVENYLLGYLDGAIRSRFLEYLKGVIRNRFFDVIGRGRKSEREILDGIVASKKADTVKEYIRAAKERFWEKARSYLLCYPLSPDDPHAVSKVDRNINSITNCFFERFIPTRYPFIKESLGRGESPLIRLLQEFSQGLKSKLDEEILSYIGKIPRLADKGMELQGGLPELGAEEELKAAEPQLKENWAKRVRAGFWDKLVRCSKLSPQEISYLRKVAMSVSGEAQRNTKLCLAFTLLKAEGSQTLKEDLRMFLVYYLSNYGTSTNIPILSSKEGLKLERLSLEKIRGRCLSWAEIFELFGRECNPSRIRERVKSKFKEL
jgi:hypothetical protein